MWKKNGSCDSLLLDQRAVTSRRVNKQQSLLSPTRVNHMPIALDCNTCAKGEGRNAIIVCVRVMTSEGASGAS